MTNELLERADRAIAERKRLIDRLSQARWKAMQLDNRLHDLHQCRIEEESKRRRPA
jgi:hypothetical protein